MDGNKYLTRMDGEFNNYHKFSKCYCESKNVYFGHSPSVDHPIIEEDSYKIKYYNSPQFEKKYQKQNQVKNHCQSCICSHLESFEPGTLVDVYLSDGIQFLGIHFIYLVPQSCCGYFLQIDDTVRPVIMDCQNIEAIRKACLDS